MAAQELQKRRSGAEAARAAFEEDLARQREFFGEHEAELLARHPGKVIAVCAGEVFVGDGAAEAISKAEAAHPDRPVLLNGPDPTFGADPADPAGSCRPGGTNAPRHGADAAFEEDLARQREFFGEHEAELLARHPGKFIAVCAGEVFVGDGDTEAISRAEAAHPDRPVLLNGPDPTFGDDPADPKASWRHGADAAFEEDLARQRKFFEEHEEELLARHPGKFIAVCAGEVFVGDDDAEATSKAEAAHPDRPILLNANEEFVGCL